MRICTFTGEVISVPDVKGNEVKFSFKIEHANNSAHEIKFCSTEMNNTHSVAIELSTRVLQKGDGLDIIAIYTDKTISMYALPKYEIVNQSLKSDAKKREL